MNKIISNLNPKVFLTNFIFIIKILIGLFMIWVFSFWIGAIVSIPLMIFIGILSIVSDFLFGFGLDNGVLFRWFEDNFMMSCSIVGVICICFYDSFKDGMKSDIKRL